MHKIGELKKIMSFSLAAVMILNTGMYSAAAEVKENEIVNVVQEYEILPSPHDISYGEEYTAYDQEINVVSDENSLDTETTEYIKEIFGNENVTFAAEADETKTNLFLSRDDLDDEVETWMRSVYEEQIDDSVLAKDESHIIIADENGISIIGNDDIGLFRGLTTIRFIQPQIEANENGYRHFVINDYADMAVRGLIEGYYGEPWTWAEKAELLKYGSDYKMNKVVYAPKFDPYHYNQWYELYPNETEDAENNIQNVETAASMGRKYKVDLVWTAHCFINNENGIRYTEGDENVEGSDINKLKAKFQQLYDVGVRAFGLLLDDIEYGPRTLDGGRYNKNEPLTDEVMAETTAVVNIMADWCAEKGDCDDLIFCPAGFVTDWMQHGFAQFFKQAYPYQELSYYDHNFRENVHIMTTGNGVFSDTDQSVADRFKKAALNEQTGYASGEERRSPLMWTNYPTVDNANYLDLGPIENFRTDLNPEDMVGLLSNPFQWANINKTLIPMITQYTWNLKDYDANEIYNTSMKYIMGSEELGEAMLILANHNSIRGSEGEGSPELNRAIGAFQSEISKENADQVLAEINKVVDACEKLLAEESYTDAGLYRQLKPYANATKDLAESIQKYMSIFAPEKNPLHMAKEAKALYERHSTYGIGTGSACAVSGTRTLVPFVQWLEANSTKLIAASEHEGFELELLIAELEEMDFTWHSEESVARLQTVLEQAKEVANNASATEEQRAAALADLQAAKEALEFVLKGNGTKEDPYLISSGTDLIMMSTIVNESAQFADDYYELTEDIYLTTTDFQPIGQKNHFAGVFDGKGHVISNLIIHQPDKDNVGLFGFVDGGTVKNVGIRKGSIAGSSKTGAIAGRTMYATITNCFSKAEVTGALNDCGGLVGMLNNSVLSNSYSWGSVTAGGESIGGLVGAANRSLNTAVGCTIENCYTAATVTGPRYTGAVIGYDESGAGEIYTITYRNLYYSGSQTAIGNNSRGEVICLSAEELTDGTLLEALIAGVQDGFSAWVEGAAGYPEFAAVTAEEVDFAELNALIEEAENMDVSSYSSASVEAFNTAVSTAKKLMNDTDISQKDVDTAIRMIKEAIENLEISNEPLITVATNMPQYDVYGIDHVIDGDFSTIFWKNGVQTPGDYIKFTFRNAKELTQVRLISVENSDMLEGADFQVSSDGMNWTTLGSFTKQTDQTIQFEAVTAKYARIILTHSSSSWLKVAEVLFNNEQNVDKTELKALIDEVESIDLSLYTEDSVELLEGTLADAKLVYENSSATAAEVESAIAYLRMRKDNLVKKEVRFEITKQPENVTAVKGETAVVTVEATGSDLTYTWYYKNPGNKKFYVSGSAFAEGNTYQIQMNSWRDGQQVYCVVTDGNGNTLTSETVTLSLVKAAIEITKQPESVTVKRSGETAVVAVEATGKELTYTWYYKNPGNKKFYVSGSAFADGNTYSIPMYAWRDGQQVYCVITDADGNTLTSDIVTLSLVKANVTITKQPVDTVVKASGETAVVTVEATGENLTYTWYYKNPGNVKFYVSGTTFADGNTYSIPMNKWRDGQQVYCVITDGNGNTVQTTTVTLGIEK